MGDAVLVDIDGTLALRGERGIYEFEKAGEDAVCVPVRSILYPFHDRGTTVIVCSGREDEYREVTEDWLAHWGVPFDRLLMRPTDDVRSDDIVKRELYDEYINGKYNIICVFDDRPRVVRMWRSLGLYVFDCNQSGLEF